MSVVLVLPCGKGAVLASDVTSIVSHTTGSSQQIAVRHGGQTTVIYFQTESGRDFTLGQLCSEWRRSVEEVPAIEIIERADKQGAGS